MSWEHAAGCAGQAAAATRGQLRIYLGSAPGAGTTYAMLSEAHQRAGRRTDVVIAGVKTRGRPRTAALLDGHEVIPPTRVPFRGVMTQELDLDAVLARKPQIALLDEFAHANVPGSRHATRWQDAEELLSAGIDVVSTVDVRQLDSLRDVAQKITGAPARQAVPDAFVCAADEIEIVDVAPEALRARMADGDIYPARQAQAALAGWFRIGNLAALRELALLWLAATLAEDRHRRRPGGPLPGRPETREKVVVALPGGPGDETLIRRAARITARMAGELLAVHVTRPAPTGPGRAAALTLQRRLVSSAGGTYHQLSDDDIPAALLTFAQAENATQLVLGAGRRCWRSALLPGTAVRSRVLRAATGIDVHIVTGTQLARDAPPAAPVVQSRQDSRQDEAAPVLPRSPPAAGGGAEAGAGARLGTGTPKAKTARPACPRGTLLRLGKGVPQAEPAVGDRPGLPRARRPA
jgi:two-component system sensor histidine kinase KdpD